MATVTLPADGGPITVHVFEADAAGNPLGAELDPSLYVVTLSDDSGAAAVNGNVITPDPAKVAGGETLDVGIALVSDTAITGASSLVLTGEATQLVANYTQAAP